VFASLQSVLCTARQRAQGAAWDRQQ